MRIGRAGSSVKAGMEVLAVPDHMEANLSARAMPDDCLWKGVRMAGPETDGKHPHKAGMDWELNWKLLERFL